MNKRKLSELSSLPPICPFKEALVDAVLQGIKITDVKQFFLDSGLTEKQPANPISSFIKRASNQDIDDFYNVAETEIN